MDIIKTKEVDKDKFAEVGYEVETKITRSAKTIAINLPQLPMEIFQQIVSFTEWGSKKQNCEVIVSLTVVNGEWVVIPWHQTPSGTLHVKFNQHDEKNTEEFGHLFDALEAVHCTIHSHNKAGAHQSSDDKDDELQKRGWHVTIGHCDKAKKNFHARYNFKRNAVYSSEGIKEIEAFQDFVQIKTQMLLALDIDEKWKDYRDHIVDTEMSKPLPHPEEWESKVVKAHVHVTTYGTGGAKGRVNPMIPKQSNLGLADGIHEETVSSLAKWRAKEVA